MRVGLASVDQPTRSGAEELSSAHEAFVWHGLLVGRVVVTRHGAIGVSCVLSQTPDSVSLKGYTISAQM